MLLEHLVYSAALALVVGMIFMHYTGRNPSWLIVVMAVFPDLDYVINRVMLACNCYYPVILNHGDFHNIISLLFFSLVVALICFKFGMKFGDALCCSMIGFAAHLAEDFFVYPAWYGYFYPWSLRVYGFVILPETRNLWNVADSRILAVGLIVLGVAFCLKIYFDGTGKWTIRSLMKNWSGNYMVIKSNVNVLLFGNSEDLEL